MCSVCFVQFDTCIQDVGYLQLQNTKSICYMYLFFYSLVHVPVQQYQIVLQVHCTCSIIFYRTLSLSHCHDKNIHMNHIDEVKNRQYKRYHFADWYPLPPPLNVITRGAVNISSRVTLFTLPKIELRHNDADFIFISLVRNLKVVLKLRANIASNEYEIR